MTDWTPEDWEAWRANNRRLLNEGWSLGTSYKLDGTVENWAEKDGVRISCDPQWNRGPAGEYIYGSIGK